MTQRIQALDGYGVDDLRQLLGGTAAQLTEQALPYYQKLVVQYDPRLEAEGRLLVRQAFAKLYALWPGGKTETKKQQETKPAAPSILTQLTDPLLSPVLRGAESEARKLGAPLLAGVAGAIGLSGLLLFLLGRWTK